MQADDDGRGVLRSPTGPRLLAPDGKAAAAGAAGVDEHSPVGMFCSLIYNAIILSVRDGWVRVFTNSLLQNHNRIQKINEWMPQALDKMQQSDCRGTSAFADMFRKALDRGTIITSSGWVV